MNTHLNTVCPRLVRHSQTRTGDRHIRRMAYVGQVSPPERQRPVLTLDSDTSVEKVFRARLDVVVEVERVAAAAAIIEPGHKIEISGNRPGVSSTQVKG